MFSKTKRNHFATRIDFKDAKWTEQAQDGLKFINIVKTDKHVSIYKTVSVYNLLQEDPGTQSQLTLQVVDRNATTAVRPMFEKETESVVQKTTERIMECLRQRAYR